MNKFNNVFLMGFICVIVPIISIIIVFYFSSGDKRESDKYPKKKNQIIYDTVKVKVYDTVRIEKIKYIRKVKESVDSTSN